MYHSVQRVPKCKNTYKFSWRIYKRSLKIHVRKNQRDKSRIDNTEKLTTLGTQDDDKQNKKHNTICVGHHYGQTNNPHKTWALLQTTGDIYERWWWKTMLPGNNTESEKFEEWPKEKHQKTNNDLQTATQQNKDRAKIFFKHKLSLVYFYFNL